MTRETLQRRNAARWRRWVVGLVLALCGAALATAAEEPVTLYQWTDSDGVFRYTPHFDRIPRYARPSAVEIQPGAAPPPKTPIYFHPDPRSPVVAIPQQPPETAPAGAAAGPPAQGGTATSSPAQGGTATSSPAQGGTATSSAAPGSGSSSDFEARIRELEAQIAEDEEALKQLISSPGADADTEVSPELREIAARLPQLQAELASLQQRRAGTGGP